MKEVRVMSEMGTQFYSPTRFLLIEPQLEYLKPLSWAEKQHGKIIAKIRRRKASIIRPFLFLLLAATFFLIEWLIAYMVQRSGGGLWIIFGAYDTVCCCFITFAMGTSILDWEPMVIVKGKKY